MNASTPTPQYEWIPEIDRTLLSGGRYRMAILAPNPWTSDQTQTYLEGKGWSVVSIGAPPADVATILAGITNSGIAAPTGWWVIATWPGATGTVLPANDGSIAYATLDFYSEIPPGETAIGAAPAPTFSAGPAVAAFMGGAAIVGALAYLSKKGVFARGHAMANPTATESNGSPTTPSTLTRSRPGRDKRGFR